MRKRFVMALCAMTLFTACGSKQKADQSTTVTITGPSLAACNNGEDDDKDGLTDFPQDPGCVSLDDNTEQNDAGNPPVAGQPGNFNLSGVCVNGRAQLTWTRSDRAQKYRIDHRIWTLGAWRIGVAETTSLSAELQGDASAANYWRIVAINSVGETASMSPVERDDKTATFACGPPAPPPPAPPTDSGPGPGPGPGPGTPTAPPTGGSCSGSSASLPDLTARGQTRGFAISAPAGCAWTLTSNNHHVVSVNPSTGTGPSSGSVTSLNAGTATICFTGSGVCRTYVIP
jgi:hypothetical protein